jgi:hypothetical protein
VLRGEYRRITSQLDHAQLGARELVQLRMGTEGEHSESIKCHYQ